MTDVEQAIVSESSRLTKAVAVLVGLSAVLAAALTAYESQQGRLEERSLLLSSRLAAEASGVIPASQSQSSFGFRSAQEALVWQSRGTARLLALTASGDAGPGEQEVAEATTAAGERLAQIAQQMAQVPENDELDGYTELVLREGAGRAAELVERQGELVDAAEAAGARADQAVLALSILAVAAVLLGFAGAVGKGRPAVLALVAGAVFLAGSAAVGIVAAV